jgi:hypothetical protein
LVLVRKLLHVSLSALLICGLSAGRILLGCQATVTTLPDGWHLLDAGDFTIYAPANWKFHKLQGIDSYVGEFVGDGVRLEFDYGLYSNSIPAEATEPTYTVTEEKIGGHLARIVSPKIPGRGITAIYFREVGNGSNGLFINAINLSDSQQKAVLVMFTTVRFRPTLPRK